MANDKSIEQRLRGLRIWNIDVGKVFNSEPDREILISLAGFLPSVDVNVVIVMAFVIEEHTDGLGA